MILKGLGTAIIAIAWTGFVMAAGAILFQHQIGTSFEAIEFIIILVASGVNMGAASCFLWDIFP
jgi:hypothetical protein